MPFEVQQATRVGAGQERLVQTLIGQTERNVHPRTRIDGDRVGVEIAGIDGTVEHVLLGAVALLHRLDAALLLQPLEDQPREIPGKGCRRVVHRAVIRRDLVVEHGRASGTRMAEQVFTNDDDHQPGWPDVLLRSGVDQAELRDVDGPRQNVRRHVDDQRRIAEIRNPIELQAADGLVARVVQVRRVLAQLPVVLPRNGEVIERFGAGRHVDVTETTRLFDRLARPDARIDVVGNAIFRQQVQRNLGKLLAGAPLRNSTL